jgi:hypothetical protein
LISQSRDRSPAGHAEAARSPSIPALLSGQVQIGHLGGSETLSAAVAGGDLVIISITGPVYPYPVVDPALFGDAVEQLAATNDKIKSFDLNSILDNSFVQSAMDRHVGAL